MYIEDQEERIAHPIASSRDSIIIGSILIAVFAMALTSICVITIIRSRRSREIQRKEQQSSVISMRAKEESPDENLTVLQGRGMRDGSSVIRLDDLVSSRTTSPVRELDLVTMGELPGSFDLSRPVRAEGPLDSHPPSPVLSPPPPTPVSSNWIAPQEWQVPINFSTAVAHRFEEANSTSRTTVDSTRKHQVGEKNTSDMVEGADIGVAR
jgi:hypothetical protein